MNLKRDRIVIDGGGLITFVDEEMSPERAEEIVVYPNGWIACLFDEAIEMYPREHIHAISLTIEGDDDED